LLFIGLFLHSEAPGLREPSVRELLNRVDGLQIRLEILERHQGKRPDGIIERYCISTMAGPMECASCRLLEDMK